jgi:hypothetical protein
MVSLERQIAGLREHGLEEEALALEFAHSPAGHAEALRRVHTALALVERAQHDLERACQELSSLAGGGSIAWARVSKSAESTHNLWRWVSYTFLPARANRLHLDEHAARSIIRAAKERSGA